MRLQVGDDLGRWHEAEMELTVDQGNNAPVARTREWVYSVLEGEPVMLDGTLSFDPDVDCGDAIVSYSWDVNGNGMFDDAGIDADGPVVEIPWGVLAMLAWPADRVTGQPSNTLTLRVTDEFGVHGLVNFSVVIYSSQPVAMVVQSPDPAPINLATGLSRPILDGRESHTQIPGVEIARMDWDLDGDGDFEIQNQPVVEYPRVFMPLPPADNLPVVIVTLRVIDSLGQVATVGYQIHYAIPPTPPTADADPSEPPEQAYHILVGDELVLDGSASFDPDAEDFGDYLRFFRWDIDGDGEWDHETVAVDDSGANPLWTVPAEILALYGIDEPGIYPIEMQTEDTTQLTNEDPTRVTVYRREPEIGMMVNPNPASCGAPVTFDASSARHPHPEVEILSWAWDLDNDGAFDDSSEPELTVRFDSFTFGAPKTVAVQVTDTAGNVAVESVEIPVTIGNLAPVAVPNGPFAIVAGESVTLDARGSWDPNGDCGDEIVRYDWDFNADGSFEFIGELVNVGWPELMAMGIDGIGDYVVRLRAIDRFGIINERFTTVSVYQGPTAVAEARPNRVGCNGAVQFDAQGSFSDGPAGHGFEIVGWEWDFDGDGEFEVGAATAIRNVVGTLEYVATLRVTDARGRTDIGTAHVDIDVANVPPVADAGEGYVTGWVEDAFAPVALDARSSFDPNAPCDELVKFAWDTDGDGLYGQEDLNGAGLMDGSDYTGAIVADYVSPTWRIGTMQVVRVRVRDASGVWSEPDEAEIKVHASPPPSGEILSPRGDAGTCVAGHELEIRFRVADPFGDNVRCTAIVGGMVVGEKVVATRVDGVAVESSMVVHTGMIPEGEHELIMEFDDGNGGIVRVDAGGRIVFDRTAPSVIMGAQPAEDVCYMPNEVPAPDYEVHDEQDPAPSVDQSLVEDGCIRTIVVRAMDACGNVGENERSYRLAQSFDVQIHGVDEGGFVADATLSWIVDAPEVCVLQTTAELSWDGNPPMPYFEGWFIDEPGSYALEVTARNCVGIPQQALRTFIVNEPPSALVDGEGVVVEGEALWLDATGSLAPEPFDRVIHYEWDMNDDGVIDDEGGVARFDTSDQGWFWGMVRATDTLGGVGQAWFEVSVLDVDPVAHAGGPYMVYQGREIELDATKSKSSAPHADPLTLYVWDFGDGSPEEAGEDLRLPLHIYDEDGIYTATVAVLDEDSAAYACAPVTVRDASPAAGQIIAPADPYEAALWTFAIDAVAGAPGEDIVNYTWYLGDDSPPALGTASQLGEPHLSRRRRLQDHRGHSGHRFCDHPYLRRARAADHAARGAASRRAAHRDRAGLADGAVHAHGHSGVVDPRCLGRGAQPSRQHHDRAAARHRPARNGSKLRRRAGQQSLAHLPSNPPRDACHARPHLGAERPPGGR